jgi:von Willebrand factor type A domain.
MHLIYPMVLWLLVVVPPLAGLAMWVAWRRNQRSIDAYGDKRIFGRFAETITSGTYLLKAFCVVAGLTMLVLALSRPSIKEGKAEFPRGSIDVIALVDASRSMAVPDYKGTLDGTPYQSSATRLDMARHLILNDVIPSLNYNRLGIVTYSGSAFPMAFLSDDMPALDWMLKRALVVGSAPGEGSEMGMAFDMAFQLFDLDSKPGHRQIIVLFSDGGNDTDVQETHKLIGQMQQRGIELIIVGLGKTTPSPIPIKLLSRGDQQRYRDKEFYEHEGQVVNSRLEENNLLLMRNMTGARYVRVVDPSDFHIGMLISSTDVKILEGEQELFMYPLMLSMALFMVALFVPRVFRGAGNNTSPSQSPSPDRKGKRR